MKARLLLVLVFVFVTGLVGVAVGPTGLEPGAVVDAFAGRADATTHAIVVEVRLPRVLLGWLVGAALALSGVLLQALLRNDLAEPYLVGVGPGAFLGVTVAALLAGGTTAVSSPATRSLFALGGAVAVSLVVFSYARKQGRSAGPTLLLAGVAIGAFASAVATALLYGALPDWHRVVYWLLGHLGPRGAGELALVGGALVAAAALAFVRARDLDAVALGEEGAWLLGVDVRRLLVLLGLAACLLAAVSVAAAGLIGFVGLLVPHLARGLVGPAHRGLIPAAMGLGAGLLVLADTMARTLFVPQELPVGVVTAALGAPFLAWILMRSR